jgi:hypothetical protein
MKKLINFFKTKEKRFLLHFNEVAVLKSSTQTF